MNGMNLSLLLLHFGAMNAVERERFAVAKVWANYQLSIMNVFLNYF